MRRTKVVEIEVCTCDKCKKEITGKVITLKRIIPGLEERIFELCEDCDFQFKAFMMGKLSSYDHKNDLVGILEEEEETIEEEEQEEPVETKKSKEWSGFDSSDDIDIRTSLPRKLKAFRKANGYSQSDLADLIGVSHGTMSNWEAGRISSVNTRTKEKLDDLLRAM